MWLSPWIDSPLWQNVTATATTFILMLTWLRTMDALAHRGWIGQRLSRKIIHTGTGPLFLLCWNLFAAGPAARWWAATVPLTVTLQFAAVGFGWIDDPAAVKAMSRSGDRREILQGPVYYGLIFVFATLVFWRHSPVGILALMILCGGDGLADIVGRRWGQRRLPWATDKSWPGSTAMLLGSWSFGLAMILVFNSWGNFSPPLLLGQTTVVVLSVALIATAVESMPWTGIDNITVFAAALLATWALVEPLGLWQARFWG
ncbi:MAG: phosphatidate cytidylyltransferase [Anaerolineales bacterium]